MTYEQISFIALGLLIGRIFFVLDRKINKQKNPKPRKNSNVDMHECPVCGLIHAKPVYQRRYS